MTDHEKLSYLTDRPCTACKFHKEEGCSKWSCVFEEKSGVPKGEYIKKEDVLKLQYRIDDSATLSTRDVVDVDDIEDLPTYSFPDREKGEWEHDESDNSVMCKKCGCFLYPSDISDGEAHFCPNCGADMRGGKE